MTVRIIVTGGRAWTTDCSTWHVITAIKVLTPIFICLLVVVVTPATMGEIDLKTVWTGTKVLLLLMMGVETIVRWMLVMARPPSRVEARW